MTDRRGIIQRDQAATACYMPLLNAAKQLGNGRVLASDLSHGQEALWFLAKLAPESWTYNVVLPAGGGDDSPTYAAVGYPAFGSLDGRTIDFFAPVTGLIRALDVAAPEYQQARLAEFRHSCRYCILY